MGPRFASHAHCALGLLDADAARRSSRSSLRPSLAAAGTLPSSAERRAQLAGAAAAWEILKISDEVVARARQPFPVDPIRALDAIHLASALAARAAAPDVELLTLDDRIRAAAKALRLPRQPM